MFQFIQSELVKWVRSNMLLINAHWKLLQLNVLLQIITQNDC